MPTAAAATTSLHVATAVLAVDFSHPAVLARELASIDQPLEGRVDVGLGVDYQVNDSASSGIVMGPPKVRVDRLIEYVEVLRGRFAARHRTTEGRGWPEYQPVVQNGAHSVLRPVDLIRMSGINRVA